MGLVEGNRERISDGKIVGAFVGELKNCSEGHVEGSPEDSKEGPWDTGDSKDVPGRRLGRGDTVNEMLGKLVDCLSDATAGEMVADGSSILSTTICPPAAVSHATAENK